MKQNLTLLTLLFLFTLTTTPTTIAAAIPPLTGATDQLPPAATKALQTTLSRQPTTNMYTTSIHLTALMWHDRWGIATLSAVPVETETFDISQLFYALLVNTPDGWQAALDREPYVHKLLTHIPTTELTMKTRRALFPGRIVAAPLVQQFAGYKFPWPEGKPWVMTGRRRGVWTYDWWHGDSPPSPIPQKHAVDFDIVDEVNSPMVAAASGEATIGCIDAHQALIVIRTDGTNNEKLGYLHLDVASIGPASSYPKHVTQGESIGYMKEVKDNTTFKSPCGMIIGTHLHLFMPTKPFVIDGETFDNGNVPAGKSLYSSQGTQEVSDTPDDATSPSSVFPDVPSTHPFYSYIETLYYIGAVNGFSDGTFRPDDAITRGAMAKVIILAMGAEYREDEPLPTPFPDIGEDNPFYLYIMRMKDLGITTGFSDGTYRPDESLTRGAIAKFLTIAHDGSEPNYNSCVATFPDVPCENTFYRHIRRLKEIFDGAGVNLGYSDGTFRPDEVITRAGVAKLAVVALGWNPVFPDVQYAHPFYRYIQALFNRSIVSGFSDGEFKPDLDVTRGELAKIVTRGLGANPQASDYPNATFPDVPRNHTFYPYIEYLVERGILNGYSDGQFRPDALVTREQAAKFIVNGLQEGFNSTCTLSQSLPFTDVPTDNLFYDDIRCLYEKGITSGYSDNTYRPSANLSRGAAAKFVYLAFIQRTPAIPQEASDSANNQRTNATAYALGQRYSVPSGDQDWIRIPSSALQSASTDGGSAGYQIVSTAPAGINADIRIEIYAANSDTPVAFESGHGSTGGTYMLWPVNSSATHDLKLVNERALVGEGTEAFLTFQPEPCPEDMNDDNLIDIADIQQIAYRWNNHYGESLYNWRHNLNADGLIDIADIQQTAYLWNVNCTIRSQMIRQPLIEASSIQQIHSATTMAFEPTALTLQKGQQATIYTHATELSNLGGFDFEFTFNPVVIHIDSVTITAFPNSTGRTLTIGANNIDNNAGKVQFVAFSLGAMPDGASGSSNLVEIKLTAVENGNSAITFTKGQITTAAGSKLNPQIQNGAVTVQGNEPAANQQAFLPVVLSGSSLNTQPNVPTATPTAAPLPTATSQPAFTVTPTSTPVPANTPIPTNTSPPANTPIPTNTPTPIPTSTPTKTPLPTHTSTPVPTPTATPFFFSDNFGSTNSGWPTVNDSAYQARYRSNEYEITIYGNNVEAWQTNSQNVTIPSNITNYSVEARMRLHSGSPIRYGFVFDVVNSTNFYIYTVNPDSQSWRLERVLSGNRTTISDGTNSVINTGGTTNLLKVKVQNGRIYMYVNGIQVDSQNGGAFIGSRRAGLAAKAGTATVTARYDDFTYRWE